MTMPLVGFQIVSASYFQAVGRPKEAMLLMLSRQLLLLIPAALILPLFFGLDGIWAALPASDCGASVLTGICLLVELRGLKAKPSDENTASTSRRVNRLDEVSVSLRRRSLSNGRIAGLSRRSYTLNPSRRIENKAVSFGDHTGP